MKQAIIFSLVAMLLSGLANAGGAMKKNTLGLEWNTNYYGNSIKVSTKSQISDHFALGLGYTKGGIYFRIKGEQSFFFVDYGDFEEFNTNIDIVHLIDFAFYYSRNKDRQINLFKTVGLGVSHYSVNFCLSEFVDDSYQGLYLNGNKYLNGFGGFISLDMLEYCPHFNDRFSFTLGSQARITSIDMPQHITLSNGYFYKTLTETSSGNKMMLVIPEAAFRFNYKF